VDSCVLESQTNVYSSSSDETDADAAGGSRSTIRFTEDELGHRVLRDLLKANVKDPAQVSKNAVIAMIEKASKA
jgi:hypothetical protein